jgi:hypothetical protein
MNSSSLSGCSLCSVRMTFMLASQILQSCTPLGVVAQPDPVHAKHRKRRCNGTSYVMGTDSKRL